jgi:hypothetical protein
MARAMPSSWPRINSPFPRGSAYYPWAACASVFAPCQPISQGITTNIRLNAVVNTGVPGFIPPDPNAGVPRATPATGQK